ncbi:NAD(P)/FAD-dependent oxidoreductase [Maritimibacter dapengensis]|uniref:NAD(P)/FAD-dependent oxidoreductase n=1 Tax=Maritimibacter dapengensis TaxID=2836868 RepID=A0ABS6T206_9RHOB|nr:NAD(P)/FAD-dependent oxidoreductase [Maritimibacter dapengensis]MBV7378407.1 NAD(P)/FAD-dependent oxidoreductase [Maritimibacter dapengensis]
MTYHRTIILGAGAAGLMAAAFAGPDTLVLDHAAKPGEKIRISGGGRCNFTNLDVTAANFHGQNPHFPKSALARYTHWDFIELVSRHGIAWHEKTLGQLFCDGKSTQIIDMLLSEMRDAGAILQLSTQIEGVTHQGGQFAVRTDKGTYTCDNLVLATGGKSIPKMGATGLAYDLARQFGHDIVTPRPALVPLTFGDRFAPLAGVSTPCTASNDRARFSEALLFTHRGLSGPAILQLSSYWHEGEAIWLDICPAALLDTLRAQRQTQGRHALTTELARHLPARLVEFLAGEMDLTGNLADQSDARLGDICDTLSAWMLTPAGSEGYRTAEVTAGGVATDGLSSKTMESKHLPGLYIIGEAVDVTGWLGGYNFQWAWASGAAAGRAIAGRA